MSSERINSLPWGGMGIRSIEPHRLLYVRVCQGIITLPPLYFSFFPGDDAVDLSTVLVRLTYMCKDKNKIGTRRRKSCSTVGSS